ncbi:HAMP domain-containing sensor histidine kinase [Ammoniphilus sp. YIM 78166]|uniref:sensor histidine kinase n=1 Tax=Ammoniphilus sp. YIM 78166 TaxID=1644106 RepID=UPI00106F4E5F|nr:HAMP domain-containing sensor histidine kinase [Ammoniphilus sp. YIM 78166]
MVVYLKDFLLNIFLIFSPLVFYPYIKRAQNNIILYKSFLYLFFALAIITTMFFPISVNGLTYDLRSIPLVVGSLYGGPVVSLLLFGTLVLCRFLLGNAHQWFYIVSILPTVFVVLLAVRSFSHLKLYQKMLVAVMLCTFMKLIIFISFLAYTQSLHLFTDNLLENIRTYLIQGIIIALYVYLIELVNRYFRLEEEVFKGEKARIVSDMAASVAHEIRNPLTAVKGFIQLLADPDIHEEKRRFFQKICLDELNRAERIISDYLSIAKPDLEIVERMNLNEEISQISSILVTYANYNNVQIDLILSQDDEVYMMGDKYKFRQALINIGKNAIEAMHNGGLLEIKVSKENGWASITISDTGVGMTTSQINRLGTPYYSTKEKGTGLGTMVSFQIIKKMQGKIDITSKLGKGTQFILRFPSV